MSPKEQAIAVLERILARGGITRKINDRVSISPPDLAKEFRPMIAECRDAFLALHYPIPSDQIGAAMLGAFGGFATTDHGDTPDEFYQPDVLGWTPKRRCEAALAVIARRDTEGRVDFTQSQVDAEGIGLKKYQHLPIVADVMEKLRAARKIALTVARLKARKPIRYRHE